MGEERKVKGIWVPIEIWESKELTWNEKILFLEIDSFSTNEKDCFFSNEHIAKLLGVTVNSANRILSSLIKKGYVVKTSFDGRKRYVKSTYTYDKAAYSQMNKQTEQNGIGRVDTNEYIPNKDNKTINNSVIIDNGDDGKFVGEVENYDAKAYTSPSDYNIENQHDRQRLVSDLLSQSLWIETLQRSFGLNVFQLPQAIDECIDEMILGGEKTKSLQDAKSHIRNLMRKKQQFKKTPGGAAAEKSWKERFTEIAVQKLTAQPKEPDNDKPFWL